MDLAIGRVQRVDAAGQIRWAAFSSRSLTVNAKNTPLEIIEPKIPENPPRSVTWNQCALTFTMETAP